MKRSILPTLALGAGFLISASGLLAQNAKAGVQTAPKPQKLVRMVTINGAAAVREFQNNVQVVQTQRQAVIDLKAALDKETNAQRKKDLKARYDAALAKLEQDNELMVKTYGFSLARNYTMEIESATIYMEVNDEEAARIEQTAKANATEQQKKAKK